MGFRGSVGGTAHHKHDREVHDALPPARPYLRGLLRAAGFLGAPSQNSRICRVASAWVAATCLFAALVAWPRAPLAALFAAVSHMLINGFFLPQGFAISIRSDPGKRPTPP